MFFEGVHICLHLLAFLLQTSHCLSTYLFFKNLYLIYSFTWHKIKTVFNKHILKGLTSLLQTQVITFIGFLCTVLLLIYVKTNMNIHPHFSFLHNRWHTYKAYIQMIHHSATFFFTPCIYVIFHQYIDSFLLFSF